MTFGSHRSLRQNSYLSLLSLVLDKDVNCGLIDFWNGSGSLLELKLEKDVKLPIKFVHEILPDSCYKWGFKNIYGCDDSFYEESLISLSL